MRIVYVSQYFPPEMGAASARVHELSREWVKMGHEVTVVTPFASYPKGIKAKRDRFRISRRETLDGIDVVRTYNWAVPNRGMVKRMVSWGTFMTSAATIGRLRVRHADAVIGTSPQPLSGVAGFSLARTLGAPFVFEVRDVWPEGVLATNFICDNAFYRASKGLARFLYTRADAIVTPGEGYRNAIHRLYGIPLSKFGVIKNGIDLELFRPCPRDEALRREYGWTDRFVVMYVGILGVAHGLDKVLDAARVLRSDPRILFVFVGEGAEKDALKRMAAENRLDNVQFIDQQPKARIPRFYAACDLGLVVLREITLHLETLPSKIFEYMGMERPILLGLDGEARHIVEAAGAGEYVSPGDAEQFAGTVLRLADDPARREEMGRSGRRYALAYHDRSALAAAYLRILEDLARKRRSA